MKFELDDEQVKKLNEWSNHCNTDAGAIGGRISIAFTSTGLGQIVEATCICGEKLGLTDYTNW